MKNVRLWIVSDLHLELTRGWDLPAAAARPDFDVMVVAGDLVTRMERGVEWLRSRVTARPVLFIPGNHEGYGCDIDRTVEKAREAAVGTNVRVMQNDVTVVDGVTFAGATLWTDFALFEKPDEAMAVAGDHMNDYRKIRKDGYVRRLRPGDTLERHKESRAFFEAELRKPRSGKLVIISHHAPHGGRHVGPDIAAPTTADEILAAAYRSDLTGLMTAGADDGRGPLTPPDIWVYGHTHESEDFRIGGTRVVSNGKGYGPWMPRETASDNARFDPHFTIDI